MERITTESFEFDNWIEMTDLVEIQSKTNDLCFHPIRIKLKVDFDDVETENAYKDHERIFSRRAQGAWFLNDAETTRMNIQCGSVQNEKLFLPRDCFIPYYFLNIHWSISMLAWFQNKLYREKIITIKKVVSIRCDRIC